MQANGKAAAGVTPSPAPATPDRGKLMSLGEAVERFVLDGAVVALGGFTINRNPMAFVYEMARRRVRDLHLVAHSNGQALDTLVGAGCVSPHRGRLRRQRPLRPDLRALSQRGRARRGRSRGLLQLPDGAALSGRARCNVPFIPTKSGLHTDLVAPDRASRRLTARPRACPTRSSSSCPTPSTATSDDVVLLPALSPDLAVVHAQTVADDGTVRIKGLTFADLEQAKAAKAVVVTCEEIVPAADAARRPRPERAAAVSGRRRRARAPRRPPHRLPLFYDYDPPS